MQRIDLVMKEDTQSFFDDLKGKKNALIVPIDKWKSIIHANLGNGRARDPEFRIAGAFVITEQDAFELFVGKIHGIFYGRTEGITTKEYGTFRFAGKIDLKRVTSSVPSHDIFDVGSRQPGSFRSK